MFIFLVVAIAGVLLCEALRIPVQTQFSGEVLMGIEAALKVVAAGFSNGRANMSGRSRPE
jgi:hypothetical protein